MLAMNGGKNMNQNQLTDSQDIFLEELSGMIAMLKNNLIKHEAVEQYYLDVVGLLKRLEEKVDNIDRRLTHMEAI
jgi:hypothetical protein